jgi:energy-converting hydrogenase Eha subunit A
MAQLNQNHLAAAVAVADARDRAEAMRMASDTYVASRQEAVNLAEQATRSFILKDYVHANELYKKLEAKLRDVVSMHALLKKRGQVAALFMFASEAASRGEMVTAAALRQAAFAFDKAPLALKQLTPGFQSTVAKKFIEVTIVTDANEELIRKAASAVLNTAAKGYAPGGLRELILPLARRGPLEFVQLGGLDSIFSKIAKKVGGAVKSVAKATIGTAKSIIKVGTTVGTLGLIKLNSVSLKGVKDALSRLDPTKKGGLKGMVGRVWKNVKAIPGSVIGMATLPAAQAIRLTGELVGKKTLVGKLTSKAAGSLENKLQPYMEKRPAVVLGVAAMVVGAVIAAPAIAAGASALVAAVGGPTAVAMAVVPAVVGAAAKALGKKDEVSSPVPESAAIAPDAIATADGREMVLGPDGQYVPSGQMAAPQAAQQVEAQQAGMFGGGAALPIIIAVSLAGAVALVLYGRSQPSGKSEGR